MAGVVGGKATAGARCVFISAERLRGLLSEPCVKGKPVVLDCSWHMPSTGRSARQEWKCEPRIPGSAFFDIDAVADRSNPLPHMLPSPSQFWRDVSKLGLQDSQQDVVLYDCSPYYVASARAYWMMQVFGVDNVKVLQGGLEAWKDGGYDMVVEKREVEESGNSTSHAAFGAKSLTFRRDLLYTKDEMLATLPSEGREVVVVDARSSGRFSGKEEEPRPGLRKGHIPYSVNIPFTQLFPEQSNGHFKSKEEVSAILESVGISLRSPPDQIVTTCGSGVTAAVVRLAMEWVGITDVALYDGSFAEWGRPGEGEGGPVATYL